MLLFMETSQACQAARQARRLPHRVPLSHSRYPYRTTFDKRERLDGSAITMRPRDSTSISDCAVVLVVGLQAGETRFEKAMSHSTEAPVYTPRLLCGEVDEASG
jgi:hypothetical protein